jgi:TIR domain-containing protein
VGSGWDFYISYTQADRAWAEWIAWILEEDGHHVLVQARRMRHPGAGIVW